jgi:hypothetical protein
VGVVAPLAAQNLQPVPEAADRDQVFGWLDVEALAQLGISKRPRAAKGLGDEAKVALDMRGQAWVCEGLGPRGIVVCTYSGIVVCTYCERL